MTLLFTSDQAMTAPLTGTPVLPDIASRLDYDYSFDALKQSVADGAAVSSVSSTGAAAMDMNAKLSDAEYPTLTHNGPNGHAALSFNGRHMLGSAGVEYPVTAGSNATLVLVLRSRSATASQRIFAPATNDGYRQIQTTATGYRVTGAETSESTATQIDTAAALNQWHVLICSYAGADRSFIQLNGGAQVPGSLGLGAMKGLRLGAGMSSFNASNAFVGDIARVMVFKRVLAEADAAGLASELMQTYGIR